MIERLRVIWRILTAPQYFYLVKTKRGEIKYACSIVDSLPDSAPGNAWTDIIYNRYMGLKIACKHAWDVLVANPM